MKRIFISILILLVILGLTGCALKIYKLPQEGFCYTTYEREEIELSQEEQEYIIDLLNDGKWYSGIAKCDSDVNFYPNGLVNPKKGYAKSSEKHGLPLRRLSSSMKSMQSFQNAEATKVRPT